jgi:hypothetical protein
MWYRGHRHGFPGFQFGFGPYGFFGRWRPWPRKEEYLRLLERYKEDLQEELKEVEREIEEVKRSKE